MLAQAEQQRQARRLITMARAVRRAGQAERQIRRATRKALRLRAQLES